MTDVAAAAARETYRHGDLRRALIDAGLMLARQGGPEAVVLREATRRSGVVPNAAYRHFRNRDDLLAAVRARALADVGAEIAEALAQLDPASKRKAYARASLRAVGIGYLAFAQREPGLFRTAFAPLPAALVPPGEAPGGTESEPKGGTPADDDLPHPFRLLGIALDRMLEAGLMPEHRRPGAEFLAWSCVHGLAVLTSEGPLRSMGSEERDALGERLVRLVERGL